jgi:ABC-2 type transport system permease protein
MGAEERAGRSLQPDVAGPASSEPVRRRPQPIQAARVGWLFLRLGAMNELQYRVNFFVRLFQSLLAVGTGLAVLALVFSHTTRLHGWTEAQLLAVLGVQILMGGVIQAVIQPNMARLIQDVREGKLDFALTKPEDAQLLVSVREVNVWSIVDVLTGGIVLGVAISRLEAGVGLGDALSFAGALVLGGVMIYCFWLIITTGAFWLVRMDQIVELFEGVYQTGRWPVGIYPGWLRLGLTFLVPIAFAVTVPAEAVTSRLTGATFLEAAGFAVFLLVFTRLFWKRGLRRYSGASA